MYVMWADHQNGKFVSLKQWQTNLKAGYSIVDTVHNSHQQLNRLQLQCFELCDPVTFDLILLGAWGHTMIMTHPVSSDCSFSRFGFIVHTHLHIQMWMKACRRREWLQKPCINAHFYLTTFNQKNIALQQKLLLTFHIIYNRATTNMVSITVNLKKGKQIVTFSCSARKKHLNSVNR